MTGSTSASISIVEDPAELPPQWDDALDRLDYHLSREWLSYTYRSSSRFGATILTNATAGLPVAGLTIHELDASSGPGVRVDTALSQSARAELSQRDPELARTMDERLFPTIACGGRSVGRSRVVELRGCAESNQSVHELLAEADRIARARQARSLTLLYVDVEDGHLRDALSALSYVPLGAWPTLVFDCPWSSFDEYLDSLSPKKRRNVRRDRRLIAEAGWRVELQELDEELSRTMGRLNALTERKYGNDMSDDASHAYFERLRAGLPGRLEVFVARAPNGDIGGAITLLRWRDALFPREIGIDRAVAGNLPIYFELGFYAPIELAAESGAVQIDWGAGLEDVKQSRGARARTCVAYAKCLDIETNDRLRAAISS
jgi:uncharacterized protein